MMKLNGSVALALILCSTTALAREPEVAAAAVEPFDGQEPRMLRLQPMESAEQPAPAPVAKATEAASDGALSPFTTPAALSSFRASAQTYAGYDGAASSARARASVDGR